MRAEDLLNRLDDMPFRLFRIHLSDGSSFDVADPGLIWIGRSAAILPTRFGKDDEGRRLVDRWRTISLLHIVQMSDLDDHGNGRSNGRKSKRRKP